MAQDRSMQVVRTPRVGEFELAGRFNPDTAATPTTFYGDVKSVAHTATGVWTVTLPDWVKGAGVNWITKMVTVALSAATDVEVQAGAVDLTVPSFIVRAVASTTAAAADIVANAENSISFVIKCKYKNRPDGSGL